MAERSLSLSYVAVGDVDVVGWWGGIWRGPGFLGVVDDDDVVDGFVVGLDDDIFFCLCVGSYLRCLW